jgi:DEAD/DEAH box helicase domain-containing protein
LYLREKKKYAQFVDYVRSYYASMTPTLKKKTIEQIKSGEVKVIICTNALEAGIDLPELDACLIRGYPGSRMSFLQRIGRAGRSKSGLVVFLPSKQSAFDFYFSGKDIRLKVSELTVY